jgi:CBF1 interacting corepressor
MLTLLPHSLQAFRPVQGKLFTSHVTRLTARNKEPAASNNKAAMVQGIKFLSKKGFNPQNLSNQKRVWEVEQQAAEERRRVADRQRQLQRERDDEELARSRGETPKLSFLYDAPPGLTGKPKTAEASAIADAAASHHYPDGGGDAEGRTASTGRKNSSVSSSLTEAHPDDDEATAAFRKLLAGAAVAPSSAVSLHHDETTRTGTMAGKFGTVLQGTDYDAYANKDNNNGDGSRDKTSSATDRTKNAASTTALEKAVGGRKPQPALTLDEQIQRFPVLANAPRAKGMTATDIGVSFKPLGSQIRNVKCLACGVWGHSRGDRECRISGWDPFAALNATTATTGTTATTSTTKMTTAVEEHSAAKTDRTAAHDESSLHHHHQRRRRRDDDDHDNDHDDHDRDQKKSKKRRKHSHRDRDDDSSNSNHDSSSSSSEDSLQRRRRRHKKKKKKKEKKEDRKRHHDKKSSS